MRFISLAFSQLLFLLCLPCLAQAEASACSAPGQFDLGVGAFEIGSNHAILWTRFVPPNAGDTPLLDLQVATDSDFHHVVRRRTVSASPTRDHTVAERVIGLGPLRDYFYRFASTGDSACLSRVGHFRTTPPPGRSEDVRFVISGDANAGYTLPRGLDFYVLSAALAEEPDFFVFFGDTVYADSGIISSGQPAVTLDEYREVHQITRGDTHLQDILASTGAYVGWDDHEVLNDYAGETVDPNRFANGARSFFEYLPVATSTDAPYRIDRSVRWGRDVELFFIDGRQFRSAEKFCNLFSPDGPPAPDTLFSPYVEDELLVPLVVPPFLQPILTLFATPSDPDCVDNVLSDPSRTYLGLSQLASLKESLLASRATWKIIINNTPISTLFSGVSDRWEGYEAERQEVFAFIGENLDPEHTLVLTTDFHVNWAIERPEFTEVIVGPIGQRPFLPAVASILPPDLQPLTPTILALGTDPIVAAANGDTLGFEPNAFSYAVVETFDDEETGEQQLRVTVRGDTSYADGANDPARVTDLFTIQLP